MAIEEVDPSAHEVSDAFLEQYFHILRQIPQEACKLYVDASVVCRPGPDGTIMSFTSLEAINEHFLSWDYKSTTFEVVSVLAQNSFKGGGVMIMVIGFLTRKDNLKRKFSQTFYLAREYTRHYIVINDIFRYTHEETSTPITLPVVESVPATEGDELNMTEPIRKIDAFAENSFNAAQGKNVVAAQKPTKPFAETVAPQPDGAKRSIDLIWIDGLLMMMLFLLLAISVGFLIT